MPPKKSKKNEKKKGKDRRRRGGPAPKPPYTREDREDALARLESLINSDRLENLLDALDEVFHGGVPSYPAWIDPETAEILDEISDLAFMWWAFFDEQVSEGGRSFVELVLTLDDLPAGQRAFLEEAKKARLRLYEVVVSKPGESLTLRDVISEGPLLRIRERVASRALRRGELIATRVLVGASGALEMDGGILQYNLMQHPRVLEAVEDELDWWAENHPESDEDAIWRELAPLLHRHARTFETPEIVNVDGEELILTKTTYRVFDAGPVSGRLDADPNVRRSTDDATTWTWRRSGSSNEEVVLGLIELDADSGTLCSTTSSLERASRCADLVESLLGDLIEFDRAERIDPTLRLETPETGAPE